VTAAALPAAIRQWYKPTFACPPTTASESVGSAVSDGALVVSAESVARQYAHATFDVARSQATAVDLDAERTRVALFRAIARLDVSRQHRTRS